MPVTAITTQAIAGPFPTLPVAATSLDLVWTAGDPANGNEFAADNLVTSGPQGSIGGDILLAWNTDTNPHNLTLQSQPDAQGRSGDITNYQVGAGVISAFKYSEFTGWSDVNGNVLLTTDSALVKFAIVRRK